jgi:SAM-dependent methyltransferase
MNSHRDNHTAKDTPSKRSRAKMWAIRLTRRAAHRPVMVVRRQYYADGMARTVLERLPDAARSRLGIDDDAARSTRKIEIGAGPYPQSGYLHVDIDPGARHLEARAVAWDLPFEDDWADEILSIHAVEHIPPRLLARTLHEWRRVLRPGGAVRIHVPNSPSLMEAYLAAETRREKWMLSGALLGMYCGPDVQGPDDLSVRSDHQILFDRSLLLGELNGAGFVELVDLTDQVTDRHTSPWKDVVDRYSIIVEGKKPVSGVAP